MASDIDEHAEIIPIISDEDDDTADTFEIPAALPILPLKNTVLFPGVILPIAVGREKSLRLIREVYQKDRIIGTLAQKDPEIENPTDADLYRIGTVAQIVKMLEMPDGSTTIIIQGKRRFRIVEMITEDPYYMARAKGLTEQKPDTEVKEFKALVGSLKDMALKIIKLSPNLPSEASFALKNIESPSFLVNFISSNGEFKVEEKQKLLEIDDLQKRANHLLELLSRELQMMELKNDIQVKVRKEIDQQQREFLLQTQIRTIQNELGGNPSEKEVEEMRNKGKEKKWSKEVADAFEKELTKLQRLNPMSAEYSVQLNYLQTILDIPWNDYTDDNFDLKRAIKILDEDHFGLEKIKDRIIEHLAVLKLKKDMKSPIICLYGPPGVGKTSLGKSIARALDRKYVRMSLGGVHDEAEIRGHRKTYIGALPGRIIQSLKKAKSANPVFVLDEVDKIGQSVHGDPASALLEVLDPEQNTNFHDNYVELDFDLSRVLFIATANTIQTISPPLRDRMELINVTGYIIEEKINIATRHLLPKQLEAHGVKHTQLILTPELMEYIVENYTRESGVRELDKTLAKVVRRIAKYISLENKYNKKLSKNDITDILGPVKYLKEKYQGNDYAGVVTGLAWTAVGGEILYIESSMSKGEGKLTLTGNLGDVMKESASLAMAYLKSHSELLKVNHDIFKKWDVHVHVPEGAIPKDGPSAGITMVVSLASLFTQRKVRRNLAMTGEITLRGKVLPVGGIKEKILAAKRAGITDILLSAENRKDIEEICKVYLKGLTFHYVHDIMEVLEIALLKEKVRHALKTE